VIDRGVRTKLLERSIQADNGCWEWTGAKIPNGYGSIRSKTGQLLAHRVAYEIFVGPIPDGMSIDHLCRNRACVSAEHLEPVTTRENVLRGVGLTARNAVKTHCLRGHEFTPENTYWTKNPSGPGRECRTCKAQFARRKRPEV
jgi:hypothetical protein